MDVRDVVEFSLNALNEGHRVIASDLNAILKTQCSSLKINCETMRVSDSIQNARDKLGRSLLKLPTLDLPNLKCIFPWKFGSNFPYVKDPVEDDFSKTQQWLIPVVGGFDLDLDYLLRLENLKTGTWNEQYWRKCIVEPVERHHAEWEKWLNGFLKQPLLDCDAVVREWLSIPSSKGGPSGDQRAFVTLLLDKSPILPEDVEKQMGKSWSEPRDSVNSYAQEINRKLKAQEANWRVVQDEGAFVIHRQSTT